MVLAKNKPEKFLDFDSVPSGNNNLTSKSAFYQEKIYHGASFKRLQGKINNSPIDFNYSFLNLGKVNEKNQIVILDESNLKQSEIYSKKAIFNLNFVCDAFDEFLEIMNKAKIRGLINEDSPFFNFTKVQGYLDIKQIYKKHLYKQFDNFIVFLQEEDKKSKIKNFDDFVRYFIKFVDLQASIVPLTLSAFNLSKFSDPRTTGLIFDLFPDDKSDDRNKFLNYLEDSHYALFFNAANQAGFSIDKEVPWRLIANIDSNQMKKRMKNYNFNREVFYQKNYKLANLEDFNLFKESMINFYTLFRTYETHTIEKKVKKCKNGFVIKQEIEFREEYKEKTDDQLWIRLYTYMRAIENNLNWDQATFNNLVDEARKLNLALDIDRALRHIENSVNLQIISKKVNRNFKF